MRRRRATVVTSYTPEVIAAAFSDFVTRDEPSEAGELPMFCPLCEERGVSRSPSASINPAEGKWHCLGKCGEGGTIAALASELHLVIPKGGQLRVAPQQMAESSPLADQDKPYEWQAALESGSGAQVERLREVLASKGILPETTSAAHVGASADQLTFPVRASGGAPWVQVKFIRYGSRGNKTVTQTPGARAMLYLAERLDQEPTLPVLVCEGEVDALLAGQESRGRFVAVGVTGGAGTVPRDLSKLASREVFIAYDCDSAGAAGAQKLAKALGRVGARVHVLDLSGLGLPVTEDHGADLSDYFRKYGGSAEALAAEMERLRNGPPEGPDEIDRAMEAAFLELGNPQRDYTSALLSEDDILDRPPMSYVVEPFVPVGMLTTVFGQPGSHKTFVGQDIQNSIRAGIDWHGHPVVPGAVLLLEAEGVQQLQARIIAWNEHHDNPPLAAFRALDVPLDLSSPEGAAALVRTVRGMEAATGERVVFVWVDPAALYMSGAENDDGNRNLAIGLNAVAKFLDIAVLLIVHTNALGDRARGTDHFRMLTGSHIKVEKLEGGLVGVVQEKVKNASPRAVILRPVEVGRSLAFDTEERMTAFEYLGRKDRSTWTQKTTIKLSEARATRDAKDTEAREMLLAEVAADPGVVQGKLLGRCKGRNVGHEVLLANLDRLVTEGALRVEIEGTGKNAPRRHYLAGGEAE